MHPRVQIKERRLFADLRRLTIDQDPRSLGGLREIKTDLGAGFPFGHDIDADVLARPQLDGLAELAQLGAAGGDLVLAGVQRLLGSPQLGGDGQAIQQDGKVDGQAGRHGEGHIGHPRLQISQVADGILARLLVLTLTGAQALSGFALGGLVGPVGRADSPEVAMTVPKQESRVRAAVQAQALLQQQDGIARTAALIGPRGLLILGLRHLGGRAWERPLSSGLASPGEERHGRYSDLQDNPLEAMWQPRPSLHAASSSHIYPLQSDEMTCARSGLWPSRPSASAVLARPPRHRAKSNATQPPRR